MTLATRLIPCLDVDAGRVVKDDYVRDEGEERDSSELGRIKADVKNPKHDGRLHDARQ